MLHYVPRFRGNDKKSGFGLFTSPSELETQLIIAKELGYIKDVDLDDIAEKIDHEAKMVASYAKKLV